MAVRVIAREPAMACHGKEPRALLKPEMRGTVIKLRFTVMKMGFSVIPAQAGIQCVSMDSRLRGNDGTVYSSYL